MNRKFHIAALIVVYVAAVRAQTTSEFITINNGLSQNYIFDIVQDSRGFIWMGTKEGINRYDGYSVVAYRNDPYDTTSLSSNTVTTVFEDRDQTLWVGTNSGGLNRFDRNSETFRRYNSSEKDTLSLSHNHILCISEGSNNTLWIGTLWGLNHFNKLTGRTDRYFTDPSNPSSIASNNIFDVIEESDTVWIATTKGFCYLVKKTGAIVQVDDPLYSDMRNRGTTTLFRDSRNRLLVGCRSGLYQYNAPFGFSPVFIANDSTKYYWISRIREDHQKNLWVSTANTLLTIPFNGNNITQVERLSNERFSRGLWIDRSHVLWAGTSGLGAMMMRPRQQQFGKRSGNFLSELFSSEISSIDKYFEQRRIKLSVDMNFRGLNFFSALHDTGSIAWFLTEEGLFRFRGNDRSPTLYRTNPVGFEKKERWPANKIFLDRNNDLWLATVGGISKFSRSSGTFSYVRLYPNSSESSVMFNASSYFDITSLTVDQNGIMWCGTPELGLIRYDMKQKRIKYYSFDAKNKNSLNTNHVLSIQEDPFHPDSILWIGTEGGGLNRLNMVTEQFSSITTAEGLPNNVIYSILLDESRNFWMSTNNGLVRFNPKTYEITSYDTQDGLQSNEFNRNEYYKTRDGKFYFGGIYGYNAFYPAQITKNTISPPVAVTEFRLFNAAVSNRSTNVLKRSITETDSIELEYADNMFSFQFAALDFNSPKKNRYAYRLDGFNDDWINANTSRIATYTNIDPGTYLFHVKASNSDGVWNDEGKKIFVTILPPFWMTWWFRALYILLFISVGPIIYYRRVSGLKKEQHRQQEVSQLLIESQESERKRIAQEMHDSLGQELLVIKNRAVMGLKTAADESKEKRQLEQISDGATNVLKLVRTLSHNLRPPELDRLGLTETIRSILTNVREATDITLHAEVDDIDGVIQKENEINLIRILQESLNNIEKHSGTSEIHVTLAKEQEQIVLTIRDKGKGFAPEAVKHGIGLAGISERVRILHGTLSIVSNFGEGTIISVTIPIQKTG